MTDIINSVRDVEIWRDNYRADIYTLTGSLGVQRAAEAIWRDPGSPPAGNDWAEWLRSEEVAEVITEALEDLDRDRG
jgi:hypothetical protein